MREGNTEFMDIRQIMEEKREELGIWQIGFTTTDMLQFKDEVRKLCEANYCGHYGKSWACPPGVGTVEECKARALKYKNVFVFTTKNDIEDSFDFEGMMEAKEIHDAVCDRVVEFFKTMKPDCYSLSGESCSRCSKCTYPDAPCRFPEKLSPSVESIGVQVNDLAKTVNVNYINGQNTVTYFGCILFD